MATGQFSFLLDVEIPIPVGKNFNFLIKPVEEPVNWFTALTYWLIIKLNNFETNRACIFHLAQWNTFFLWKDDNRCKTYLYHLLLISIGKILIDGFSQIACLPFSISKTAQTNKEIKILFETLAILVLTAKQLIILL